MSRDVIDTYQTMMEEIAIKYPVSDVKAREIIRKYDTEFRKHHISSTREFEKFVNGRHPALRYKY